MLKNPFDARWGLLPTLWWVGAWLATHPASFVLSSREKISQQKSNRQPLCSKMGTSPLSPSSLGLSWILKCTYWCTLVHCGGVTLHQFMQEDPHTYSDYSSFGQALNVPWSFPFTGVTKDMTVQWFWYLRCPPSQSPHVVYASILNKIS